MCTSLKFKFTVSLIITGNYKLYDIITTINNQHFNLFLYLKLLKNIKKNLNFYFFNIYFISNKNREYLYLKYEYTPTS